MNGRGRKAKGANGERELIRILSDRLPDLSLTRNLTQSRSGGADCLDLPGVALEIKRQENLAIPQWWQQTLKQAGDSLVPVLAYRQSRRPWAVVVSLAWLTGLDFPPTAIATIGLDEFIELVKTMPRN